MKVRDTAIPAREIPARAISASYYYSASPGIGLYAFVVRFKTVRHTFDLTLKATSKICSRRHSIFGNFYFSEKISLYISRESSVWQTIHMKCQDIFALKIKSKICQNVVCCSCDWRFKVNISSFIFVYPMLL